MHGLLFFWNHECTFIAKIYLRNVTSEKIKNTKLETQRTSKNDADRIMALAIVGRIILKYILQKKFMGCALD